MWYPHGRRLLHRGGPGEAGGEAGVELRTSCAGGGDPGGGGRATGVGLESGEFVSADIVMSNADLPYTYRQAHRAGSTGATIPTARLDRMKYACSGYVLYLGLDTVSTRSSPPGALLLPRTTAPTWTPSSGTRRCRRTLPSTCACPPVTDPSLAPAGHSCIYLLAPMPNLSGSVDWEQAAPVVRQQLLSRLEKLVDPDIARAHRLGAPVPARRTGSGTTTPILGTAFGSLAQDFFQSAYFRPHNKSRHIARALLCRARGPIPASACPWWSSRPGW